MAKQIATKDTRVIRAAKTAINGIDPQDVHRSYRYEQGFTFELNLTGAADEARQRFLEGSRDVRDKRMTADEVVSTLSDGMTIGIGGWGSRRKPMALVRAILRSPLRDLTVVSYGGPDLGLLCAAGKVRKAVYGFVSLDSIPYDPWFRQGPRVRRHQVRELDEGMLQCGLRAAAHRLPFLPIRAGLGSDVLTLDPSLRTVRSPYEDGEELVAMPPLHLDVALVHLNRADRHGNARYLGPDPYFDDLFCLAADEALRVLRVHSGHHR